MPSEVSPQREVVDREHFDGIAESYTRKDATPASRAARRFRLEATLAPASLPRPFDALEIGCGAGYATDYLGDDLGNYVGVDHSSELIAIAIDRNGGENRQFTAARVQDLTMMESFDCVFVIGVLHHLEDVDGALRAMRDALRPGGWIAVNEPQPTNPLIRVARRIRKRVDSTYSADQVEFRADQLTAMLTSIGLGGVTTYPQGYFSPPFAEITFPFPKLTARLASVAVRADRWLAARGAMKSLAWNCVAVGRRPMSSPVAD